MNYIILIKTKFQIIAYILILKNLTINTYFLVEHLEFNVSYLQVVGMTMMILNETFWNTQVGNRSQNEITYVLQF